MSRDYEREDVAQDYDKVRPDYPEEVRKVVMDCFERNSIQKGRKRFLLDVGCGTGKSTELFSADFDKILGIDISAAQIDIAREKMKNLEHIEFQVVHDNFFPVEDGSVDVVLCATALHYLHLPTFLAECDRVLVDGGIVAVVTYAARILRSMDGTEIGDLADEKSEYYRAHAEFFKACGMDKYPLECCIGLYRPIYDSIENPTKRWEAKINVELVWTVRRFFRILETVAGYKERRYQTQSFSDDPLHVYITALSKIFQENGMEFAMDTQMVVSFDMPVIIIDKKDGYKIK